MNQPDPMHRTFLRLSLLTIVLGLAVGCATHFSNPPLTQSDPATSYQFQESRSPTNSPKLFVILTFSGGGTRAAALSYGVLKELAKAQIVIDGQPRRLLDEIDVISSVSAGSFTSAYFALFGDGIFEDFEQKFLKRNIQGKLTRMMISPWFWPRLWSPYYNRDDMAADHYHKKIFESKTFADLAVREQAPFLLINATDVELGARFDFTQAPLRVVNKADSAFFKTMPTSFKLKPNGVDRLTELAEDQLRNQKNYKRLLNDLDATEQPR